MAGYAGGYPDSQAAQWVDDSIREIGQLPTTPRRREKWRRHLDAAAMKLAEECPEPRAWPERPLTLDEEYLALLAFHDSHCQVEDGPSDEYLVEPLLPRLLEGKDPGKLLRQHYTAWAEWFVWAGGLPLADGGESDRRLILMALAAVKADLANKKRPEAEKHSWTQPELDEAIRKYGEEKGYAEMRNAANRGGAAGEKAKKAAIPIFGRNAVARALGVKSRDMVSKSLVWRAMAEELSLIQAKDVRRALAGGKVGYDVAIEEKSTHPDEGADNSSAESSLERAEREETLRQIRELACAGKTPEEKAQNREAAEAIEGHLNRDEMTDDQARECAQMSMNSERLSQ